MSSKIEWTEKTWNPIVGCSKISEGCENCYAEKMARRLYDMDATRKINDFVQGQFEFRTDGISAYSDVIESDDEGKLYGWNGRTAFVESALHKPVKRKKPTTYFVCDMGDLFRAPMRWIDLVMATIAYCPQHTFLLLTKRAQAMRDYFLDEDTPSRISRQNIHLDVADVCAAVHRLYLGVSVESQDTADERIPTLCQINAGGRFVSCEPLLGSVDITPWTQLGLECCDSVCGWRGSEYTAKRVDWDDEPDGWGCPECGEPCAHFPIDEKIDQVIAGGESGPNARPMHPEWVESLRDQCAEADVPFFFKQWGRWLHIDQVDDCEDEDTRRWMSDEAPWQPNAIKNNFVPVGKKKAGRTLNGRKHDELIWRKA